MVNKKKKVLITGGGGYIGTIVAKHFIEAGFDVTVLDTFYWGKKPLEAYLPKIKLIQKDIRDVNLEDLKNYTVIVHTAGLSNDPMANFNPRANFQVNTNATANLAALAKKAGAQKFIFASSASIYYLKGKSGKTIQDETSKVSPKAAYSLSKYKAEKKLMALRGSEFHPVIFRQGTVYGFSPRMRYDLVVNTMVKDALYKKEIKVFCKGEQWRPLVDVNDVAQAYIVACISDPQIISGQIFNLVYKNYKMIDLAKIIKSVFKKHANLNVKIIVEMEDRKDRSYKISDEKTRKILNWKPKIPVEESIVEMLQNIKGDYTNFLHPRYYNIEWMMTLIELEQTIKKVKKIFR